MRLRITKLLAFTKEWWLFLCVTNLILLSFWSSLGNGYYLGKWVPIALAGALFATDVLWRRYGAALAINFLYCTGSTIWIDCAKNRYATLNPYELQALKVFAVEAGWKLALAALPFLYLATNPTSHVEGIRKMGRLLCFAFFVSSVLQTVWVWATLGCKGVVPCGGALLNPSLNTAMMAILLPFMPYPLLCAALVAGCAFLGKTSIGAGMVAVYLAGWALLKAPRRWRIPLLVLLPLTVMVLGYLTHQDKNFFDSSGRFQMWNFFMRLWAGNPGNWIFGVGFGTFGVFSHSLQHAYHVNENDWWVWPHNDPMEQLFVGGWVGVTLLSWLYLDVCRKLHRKGFVAELSAFLMFGFASLGEYFLHIGPCCVFVVWILTIALLTPQNEPIGEMQ